MGAASGHETAAEGKLNGSHEHRLSYCRAYLNNKVTFCLFNPEV